MAFGCAICTVKLDQPPAEDEAEKNAGPSSNSGQINITATPCGHIFHTDCIQRWLSGNMESNRLCPCCRKKVRGKKCLSVFPTAMGNASHLGSSHESCNKDAKIANLEGQVRRLEGQLKRKSRQNENLRDRAELAEASLNIYKRELEMANGKFDGLRMGYQNVWRENGRVKAELEKRNLDYQQLENMYKMSNSRPSQAENSRSFYRTNGSPDGAWNNFIVPVSPIIHGNEVSGMQGLIPRAPLLIKKKLVKTSRKKPENPVPGSTSHT